MVWLLFLLAFLIPRISIILLWFFSSWFQGMFHTLLWPILGFIFLPATLLWYSIVYNYFDNSWTLIPVIGLIIALIVDISPGGGRRYYRRRNY
ncbi:MAG: hypothetical protein Q8933_03720 [Bacteroidota bacterium]|nr:hypothetical protein [Bacteroidota bacterium]MDP4192629.1 hypothetical protein [Bacteroidota bacterium]